MAEVAFERRRRYAQRLRCRARGRNPRRHRLLSSAQGHTGADHRARSRDSFRGVPEQFSVAHNFPQWKRGAPTSNRRIATIDARQILVQSGVLTYDDLRRDLHATVADISSVITPDISKQIYSGTVNSPATTIVIKDFKPVAVITHAEFRDAGGALALPTVDLRGDGVRVHGSGAIDPLSQAAYNFQISSSLSLARVRQVVSMEKSLGGELTLDGRLHGKEGDSHWRDPSLVPEASRRCLRPRQFEGNSFD